MGAALIVISGLILTGYIVNRLLTHRETIKRNEILTNQRIKKYENYNSNNDSK